VQWRFLDAQPAPYKVLLARRQDHPVGYIAYRAWTPRGGPNAYIGDIFAGPEDRDTVAALVGAALDDLWGMGVGMAMVTAVPGSALYDALRQLGGRPSAAAFLYDLIPLDETLPIETIADPALWLASGSDSDVV
jgi:hypothetical protein